MNAYCRHLGADLSMGKVIGNDIQCAFHHWQYGPDGGCTKIPASDKIPRAARVFKFPTVEKWGLIWAFNGTKPLFEVPEFVDYAEPDLDIRTAEAFDLPVEPWVPFTNSMDFQHLRVLHGLKIECDPDAIEDPDNFIIDRPRPRQHLSFGFGIHRCVGNRLAELQLRILWEELLPRHPVIEVLAAPRRTYSNFIHGMRSMPVRIPALN